MLVLELADGLSCVMAIRIKPKKKPGFIPESICSFASVADPLAATLTIDPDGALTWRIDECSATLSAKDFAPFAHKWIMLGCYAKLDGAQLKLELEINNKVTATAACNYRGPERLIAFTLGGGAVCDILPPSITKTVMSAADRAAALAYFKDKSDIA